MSTDAPIVEFTVQYLGGLPEAPRPGKRRRVLIFASTWGIGYATGPDKGPVCEWDDIACVGVDGGEVAKRKVGAVVVFGALGGLAAKAARDRSYIVVTNPICSLTPAEAR